MGPQLTYQMGPESSARLGQLPAKGIAQRLSKVLNTIRAQRWSVEEFLNAFVQEYDSRGEKIIIKGRRHIKTASRRRDLFKRVLDQPTFRQSFGSYVYVPSLLSEFQALRTTPYFGTFDHTMAFEDLDFNVASQVVERNAPLWHQLATQLLRNTRAHRDSHTGKADLDRRIFMISSMVSIPEAVFDFCILLLHFRPSLTLRPPRGVFPVTLTIVSSSRSCRSVQKYAGVSGST